MMDTHTDRTTIGITGARGLLGTHTRASFHVLDRYDALPADRSTFANPASLETFIGRCDAVVHYAGLNRGPESEITDVNLRLTRALLEACDRTGRAPHLVFSSSTHVDRATAYGTAKRRCAELIADWATRRGAPFTNMILPHVFGEGGRPFHNSVVATFAHQLARGEEPRIDSDGELELMHASEVARVARAEIERGESGELRPRGRPLRVSELLSKLRAFHASYSAGIVPDVRDALDRDLFNVLRTEHYAVRPLNDLVLRSDPRGTLFETIKADQGGQSFVSTTKPRITRGEHFHFKKLERFIVLRGSATIAVRHLFHGRLQEFQVNGERPQFVDMPPLHPHNITNTGPEELITQFWTDEIFDPQRPDTFPESVGDSASAAFRP